MKVGDRVLYQLEQGLDMFYVSAVIKSIGPKRITIVDDKHHLVRRVMPKRLRPLAKSFAAR